MKAIITILRGLILIASACGFADGAASAWAGPTNEIRIVNLQGSLEIIRRGAVTGVKTTDTNQPALQPFDRLRTGPDSRVTLLWTDQSPVSFGALTELEILPPHATDADAGLHLIRGVLSFFHRDQPGRIRVITRGATAGIKGTEFVVEVADAGDTERTTLSVMDGIVTFTNEVDALVLTNGQQAVAEPGRAPVRTAGFNATNLLQWSFYYPAVLDLNDLPLMIGEQKILGESLAEYRAGDLLAALAKYPAGQTSDSDAVRVYHAALLLSVGQVEQAEKNLAALSAAGASSKFPRLVNALRQLIAAVKRDSRPSTLDPRLSTEFLAASYYEQSHAIRDTSLKTALQLARQAVTNSPEFGFGWERVAELEFDFGRTDRALEALDKSLALAPRNAQALALNGFLLAAQNRTREAIGWFDRALAVDSALGNAWLGRGLCRIRRGDARGGREDLLLAAALEPQRAALRSYLGKAWSDAGDDTHARKEISLAQKLDANDPTSWLYSALNNEQHNRINEAIRDLEKSQELNDNRAVYRSGLLLDQDRAVRSANLARIYDEAGLSDVAVREAGRAVAADYTSYSAHLFLADAYQQSLAATPFGLRYETPAFSEFLITALLGPADGRLLAQPVSQQEYTRLLDRDGVGLSSSTEYLSRGAWHQYGSQYGTLNGTSYALEADYQSDPGQAANADFERRTFSAKIKQMLGPKDSVFLQVYETRLTGGDLAQHYDPSTTQRGLSLQENQSPNVLLGYHREWSPNSHTLVLASRIDDRVTIHHPSGFELLLGTADGTPVSVDAIGLTRNFSRHYIANSLELQQVQKLGSHTFILGMRVQLNEEKVMNGDEARTGNLPGNAADSLFPPTPFVLPAESVDVKNWRASFYAYDYWQVNDQWQVFGGVTDDYLRLARNTIAPPLSDGHQEVYYLSPKAGLLWQPCKEATFRLGYSRAVTGQDFDQSIRLEPTHLNGLPSTFRTAFPDSIIGGVSGERIEVWQADGRFHFGKNTYAVLGLQQVQSKEDRQVGAYTSDFFAPGFHSGQVNESLRFTEHSLHFSLRQMVGDSGSLGVRYEVAKAQLNQNYLVNPGYVVSTEGVLHAVTLDAKVFTPSGLFAEVDATWRLQTALTDSALSGALPDESFWQMNLFAGYRSPRRHFECTLGLLNLTGQDYRLHPINAYLDLPRGRTVALIFRFNL